MAACVSYTKVQFYSREAFFSLIMFLQLIRGSSQRDVEVFNDEYCGMNFPNCSTSICVFCLNINGMSSDDDDGFIGIARIL